MHKTIVFCMTVILIAILCGCTEHPVQPLSENNGSNQEVLAGKPAFKYEIVFDQGPDTGKPGKCLSNFTPKEHFADKFSFDKNTKISGIIIYTRVISEDVHIKILSDIKGRPGKYLYEENTAPDSWIIYPTGNKKPQYEMTVYLSTPFKAMANTTYWIGVSGNDKDIGQYSVHAPGDGKMALFNGRKFRGTINGDMMFKLVSVESHGNKVLDADAGDDQTIYANEIPVLVPLDGSGSRGHNLKYEWSRKRKVFSTDVSPEIKLGYGTYIFELTVTDNKGNMDTDTVTVNVMKAPLHGFGINVITSEIWPPNHKMVLAAVVYPAGKPISEPPGTIKKIIIEEPIEKRVSVRVKSNEPEDGTGDGDTAPDWELVYNVDKTVDVFLRAERSGLGDGRIYTITASYGNNRETATVTVPESMGSGKK